MQLMPATARRFGVANAFDPIDNIQGGARYLKYLLDLYKGDYQSGAGGLQCRRRRGGKVRSGAAVSRNHELSGAGGPADSEELAAALPPETKPVDAKVAEAQPAGPGAYSGSCGSRRNGTLHFTLKFWL